MARVSKKVSAAQREAENAPHRVWKTAIYARLSDFDDVLRNTESLEVQISYVKEYINHRDDLMLLDVFADKRCTGTNFDRPEFERLLKALQERKIDCIVVKDFSRLGRNFVETGQYLEQMFPLFGVRFIAINDNYDSLNSQSRDGMLVPIKSMINEMYSKDLSQKIQSCFRSKEARGEIYTPVPFGYKKDQKNHLVLDEEVSDVVVRIFLWKKSGMKEREIAKKLSAQGIQTPFTRRCQLGYLKNTLRVKDPAWQPAFVTKVLENPIYTGTMVYNRIAYDETYRKIGQNARTGMEYVLVGDYYLPALKLPRTRPIGRWGMLHKAYLKLRKPAYYQSLLLSGKLDTVLANVEEQAVERYEVLIEQLSQRESVSEKLKEENQMEWVRRMRNLENRAAEIVKAELIYTFERR